MEVFKNWLHLDSVEDDNINEFEIVKKFKSHNIIRERIELYKDFTINLINFVYDSYLGFEFIKTEQDIRGHFTWAFGKVLEEFEDEGINFYGNDELFEYFFAYFQDQFYNRRKVEPLSHYEKFWLDIFNLSIESKQKKIFEILLELYDMFNESLETKFTEAKLI